MNNFTSMKLLTFLEGKKTYIAGIISVALGIWLKNMELIMIGLTGMGLRAGISKLDNK